ncbi:hypothetical protein [Halopseudomonas maritima]|uniref:hypothetical protein n=1 Tax=Halopseudomonas maritima TaxID=2918528 RepID=UPI001EEAE9CA|nr:hypothetical protein [Halopseudomonas maritima]UJJ33056.1 hypothetical protein HV822_07895 [Halopseudomonas maritima]
MSKGFFENVAADKSQLGFDYQDLVCLEYLIDMKPGETVGLEIFDDVHHERICGSNSLIQVKHSINDNSTLTNRDIDLWKTLYNWSKALDQLSSSDIEFIFFTNKKKTSQSGIIQLLDTEKPNTPDLIKLISETKEDIGAKEKEKDAGAAANPIKKYIDYIDSLDYAKKYKLLSKIKFIFSLEDIFSRLTKKIEFFSISEGQSLDVVYQLIGAFREQKYKLISGKKKMSIDYTTFRKTFQFDRIIQISQDRKIDFSRYHQFKNINTIDPKNGIFAKQLADIDIPPEDITEYAIEYAATNMFIQKLIISGDFSKSENESINEEVFYGWKSLHERLYDRDGIDTNNEHNRVARNCFRGIGDIPVAVANSSLSRAMVTGKGEELSDICRIGWRKDWKDLYGNNK